MIMAGLVVRVSPADAQIVRGQVTEVGSQLPVVGALVSVLGETGDSALVNALTNPTGHYALRAPGAGVYRLAVKKIGVQRFVTVPFKLEVGDTRELDVPIASIAMALPEVTVSGLCAARPREFGRISALWEEARTALDATTISLRDQLMDVNITRYAAELDPDNLRPLFDWRSDGRVTTRQPFSSLTGDELSAAGYVRRLPGDSIEYLAPDASALASNAFIRDHCFTLAAASRNRPGLVGIGFRPTARRELPDIMGTVWLDARSFELRMVEFRYTRVPATLYAHRAGGEVHFARLASGAWVVDRWFIRMPQVLKPDAAEPRHQLFEEGGAALTEGAFPMRRPGRLVGVVRDSIGRPVSGAVVRALGTYRQAVTGRDGAYRLDSLPAGSIAVTVHTDGYDAFAVLAGRARVDIHPGVESRVDLLGPRADDIRRETCLDPNLRYIQRARPRGALRVLMVDNATSVPMPGVSIQAQWASRVGVASEIQIAVTDMRGAAAFCDLPVDFPVDISLIGTDGTPVYTTTVRVKRAGIATRVIRGQRTR
jgi:hypothetical protein